jgi:histidinol-phosphate/aromatic aminotransferase/cobyric acid decarboxylase-like protein
VQTKVWLDETYVEYVGPDQSLERHAARSSNVFVCKSMSKVYALSGLRVAYLCGPAPHVAALGALSPPWSVSLPGQLAAVFALRDPGYYEDCYRLTHEYRAALADRLESTAGLRVTPSVANFLLLHLPSTGPDAATVLDRCRESGLFLRDVSSMGTGLGPRAIRTAVKTPRENELIADILEASLR